MSDDVVHHDNVQFYVLFLETIEIKAQEAFGEDLDAIVHWYIGDANYSSVPFKYPKITAANATHGLKNCGFVVLPNEAAEADEDNLQLTISISTLEGEHLGIVRFRLLDTVSGR